MKLVAGLGNPGIEYAGTFHNLGFMAIDDLADKLNIQVTTKSGKSLIGTTFVGGEKVILAKPQTYMNLSGESIYELVSYYKIKPEDVIVIHDDFDLKTGFLRIRADGSAGTHNGVKNIVKMLGTEKFKRIRIGFKPENQHIALIDYVLSGIPSADKDIMKKAVEKAADAAYDIVSGKDFEYVMRTYNGEVKL
ncbi:MAG: aminoacyl-tRNA hydrolase [Clostridia bacterium]|nr:aminoacyl-tRNA hydrolase [Clostridia bacterium]